MSESYAITFYWPRVSSIAADGTLSMRVTGADGETRWNGQKIIKTSDPEYEFWKFVIGIKDRYPHFFDDEELERLKKDFAAKDFLTDTNAA